MPAKTIIVRRPPGRLASAIARFAARLARFRPHRPPRQTRVEIPDGLRRDVGLPPEVRPPSSGPPPRVF